MNIQVTVAIIGVAAALLGSAIGGFASYFSTRSMRKLEWKLAQIDREIEKRESTYQEFLTQANLAMISAFDRNADWKTAVKPVLSLESKVRLISPDIGVLAREIASCVLDHHQKDKEVKAAYPELRDNFIDACRKQLDAMRANV